MSSLLTSDSLISLLTLTLLEIVLGIDNIIFISIIAAKLPVSLQSKGRRIGLSLAMIVRIGLLLGISFIIGLKADLFTIYGYDWVLICGANLRERARWICNIPINSILI